MKMDRFACSGWLRVTFNSNDVSIARVRITHHHVHTPYVNIGLGEKEKNLIQELRHLAPSKVCINLTTTHESGDTNSELL